MTLAKSRVALLPVGLTLVVMFIMSVVLGFCGHPRPAFAQGTVCGPYEVMWRVAHEAYDLRPFAEFDKPDDPTRRSVLLVSSSGEVHVFVVDSAGPEETACLVTAGVNFRSKVTPPKGRPS